MRTTTIDITGWLQEHHDRLEPGTDLTALAEDLNEWLYYWSPDETTPPPHKGDTPLDYAMREGIGLPLLQALTARHTPEAWRTITLTDGTTVTDMTHPTDTGISTRHFGCIPTRVTGITGVRREDHADPLVPATLTLHGYRFIHLADTDYELGTVRGYMARTPDNVYDITFQAADVPVAVLADVFRTFDATPPTVPRVWELHNLAAQPLKPIPEDEREDGTFLNPQVDYNPYDDDVWGHDVTALNPAEYPPATPDGLYRLLAECVAEWDTVHPEWKKGQS